MVIAHNIGAMNTNRQVKIVSKNMFNSTQKLSSGYKINKSADNAAGLGISEKMRSQIRGLFRGANNIDDGISYCQTADGALNEMHDILQRMNELSVQAANGLNSKSDRLAIDDEIQALKEEMDRICQTTKFNDEYIFKCEDNKLLEHETYSLDYYGMYTGVEIYNESANVTATGITATYGGIVYNGVRTSWNAINPNMYDATTGLFRAGAYDMIADDGTQFTFVCEDGAVPPKMKMQGVIEADKYGVKVGSEFVSWKNVVDENGKKINPDNIKKEEYTIRSNGMRVKFRPQEGDSFEDVISKLCGCKWESECEIPHEETAVFADFSDSKLSVTDNSKVKEYIDNNYSVNTAYEIKADDTGMWIEDTTSGSIMANTFKSWQSMGFNNWGNGSSDISEDKEYHYKCNLGQGSSGDFEIVFNVQNEISLDSLVAALDGTKLVSNGSANGTKSIAAMELNTTSAPEIKKAVISANTISLNTEEEYRLGRDFSNLNVYGDEQAVYDSTDNSMDITFSATIDGILTEKKYKTDNLDTLTSVMANEIKSKMLTYYQTIYKRYVAGADNPETLNMAALIGNDKVTGGGNLTYLEDVLQIDSSDADMKTTQAMSGNAGYASAYIDFSGLGTSYQLGDLIGLGYNSNCETCTEHYSLQFDSASMNTAQNWKNITIDGHTYKYSYVGSTYGNNKILSIDLDSMAHITDGTQFTNALIDIISKSHTGFSNHYTQYATKVNDSKLYLYDNRKEYVSHGVSTARSAHFEPISYSFDTQKNINLRFTDTTDSSKYINALYTYDYGNMIDRNVSGRLITTNDPNGAYVNNNGVYEKYDPANPAHSGLQRVNITGMDNTIDINDIKQKIKDNIYQKLADNTKMKLQPTNFMSADVTGQMDNSDNKVMITDNDRPKEVKRDKVISEPEKTLYMRIQCSSNTIDLLEIEKYKLSVYRLGLDKLNVKTQSASDDAINMVARALQQISTVRSSIGAYQNRLEHAYNANLNTHENTTAAESRIRDTDMDEEMVTNANNNILQQVGQSMLAQTNQSNQGVLALIK